MKPQIYSEFWSFRGSSGAGHAKSGLLSLCDYWATLFHNQQSSAMLEYVSSETRQLVRRDEFWLARCATYLSKEHRFEIFAIPNYVDVGVLAFHKDLEVSLRSGRQSALDRRNERSAILSTMRASG